VSRVSGCVIPNDPVIEAAVFNSRPEDHRRPHPNPKGLVS